MEIVSIKRPNNGNPTTGLKIYATILGDSGTEYKVGYFRRPSFRGWMCSCPNFVLSQFGKGGHCKHIDKIQKDFGRYGALVSPSKAKPKSTTVVFDVSEKVAESIALDNAAKPGETYQDPVFGTVTIPKEGDFVG